MSVERPAEVSFTSAVTAQEIRFREVPDNRVDFTGHPGHESVSGSDRTHLPDPVPPGVTYRDVRVDYRIVSKLIMEPGVRDSDAS